MRGTITDTMCFSLTWRGKYHEFSFVKIGKDWYVLSPRKIRPLRRNKKHSVSLTDDNTLISENVDTD